MKAEIISVGTELLLGDIINTNAQFLSKELATLGINMYRQTVIGDNENRLLQAFKDAFKDCDIIITTGGLGPTQDDLTKETAAKYFNKDMELDNKSYDFLIEYFKKNGRRLSENNKKQAYFPKDSIIMENKNGTAPGCIIEGEGNKTIIVLPGPPKEMKPMFIEQVVPYFKKYTEDILVSKVLRVCGVGESHMEEMIQDLIENQTNPTIAPYAKDVDVILRITAKAKTEEEGKNLIKPMEDKVREILGDNIYGEGENPLEYVVTQLLIDKGFTISTAESCTGGMIASMIVNYPGASKTFLEGAVTYSNEAKVNRLGVKKETLDKFGAVSEETAIEMAEGICKTSNSDIGISVTGIAGPDGGSEDKPVGLVYVGLSIQGKTKVKKFTFQGNRDKVRTRTVMNTLDWLRREILNLNN